MAVTLDVAGVRGALRLGDSTEETAEATRLLGFVTEAISRHLGNAYEATPEVIVNEGAVRLAAYLYDQPNAGRGVGFANAMRGSGCSSILLPYRIHRAGSTAEAVTAAQEAMGSTDNPVTGIAITGQTLHVTFADGTVVDETLPESGTDEAGVRALVQDWAEQGNAEPIPLEKLTNVPTGDGSVGSLGLSDSILGSATVSITSPMVWHATGLTLPIDKRWLYLSVGPHTETGGGATTYYGANPWARVLIADMLLLPDGTNGGTALDQSTVSASDVNAINAEIAELQSFRDVLVGLTGANEILVAVPHLNAGKTLTGPVRFRVS